MTKLIKPAIFIVFTMILLIAVTGVMLILSVPTEGLHNENFWSVFAKTRVLGAALLVFVYFSFKWMYKYKDKQNGS